MQELTPDLSARTSRVIHTPFYRETVQPWVWLAFRVIVGFFLVVEGWPRIQAPMEQSAFVTVLGLEPAWLMAPALAALQFVGGIMVMLGLWVRPVALANAAVMLLTYFNYVAQPFEATLLSPEGIAFLRQNSQFLTSTGQECLLPDGGAAFVSMFQQKTQHSSIYWAAGAVLVGIFGSGKMSLDHAIVRSREL